ncbi:choline/carnitine O-acyltransferase [Sporosarcina ureae]|nr:choline/carnitine O-acyltransferase [Sporosarcina ureae]
MKKNSKKLNGSYNSVFKEKGEAQKGFGVERHLYGIHKIFPMYGDKHEREKAPALFTDPSYFKMRWKNYEMLH